MITLIYTFPFLPLVSGLSFSQTLRGGLPVCKYCRPSTEQTATISSAIWSLSFPTYKLETSKSLLGGVKFTDY